MKRFLIFGLILALLCTASCRQTTYRDDVACETLTASVCEEIDGDEEFVPFGEEHIRYSFEDTDRFADHSLVYSVRSENIDEIGVFLAKSDEDVAELRRVCEEYVRTLQKEQRAFVASYAPREATKLDNAAVRVFGRYVVYAVLDEEACEEAFSCVKEMLEE